MTNSIKDYEDVRSLIQLYIDGSNGDAAKLRAAFHPQARMAGHIGDLVSDNEPIDDFITLIEATPGLAGPEYRAYVRSIDLDGDAGDYIGWHRLDDCDIGVGCEGDPYHAAGSVLDHDCLIRARCDVSRNQPTDQFENYLGRVLAD